MNPVLIYITARNREEAISISRELLQRKLVACCNIIDQVNSFYWWQGNIENNEESVIIAKTFDFHAENVIDSVKKIHSYNCPAILVVPLITANSDYIEWMREQVTD